MATDATLRTDYVEARIMGWLDGLSLTGSPEVYHADTPRSASPATTTTPLLRASFRPLDPMRTGRWDATRSALRMAVLVVVDLFWPDNEAGEGSSYDTPAVVAELQNHLQYLTLSFLDYSTPSSPVTVSDAYLRVISPVVQRKLSPERPYRRWQVRAPVEWVGRVEDSFA